MITADRIEKARKAGYTDDQIVNSISQHDPDYAEKIQKARATGYGNTAIVRSFEKRLKVNAPQKKLIDSFQSGFSKSTSGKAATLAFGGQEEEQDTEDPGFWESLISESGTIAGDLPYLAAGATLGAAVGGAAGSIIPGLGTAVGSAVGGSFGALAMPAFLKQSIDEYKSYVKQGNDITFGEFLERADRVASKTMKEGLFGTILGSVRKAMPILQKTPGIGKLFESKLGQTAATVTGEAALATAVPAAVEGRVPEGKDFARALALFAGFNLAQLPSNIREDIQRRGEASGKAPEEFVKTLPRAELDDIAAQAIAQKSKEPSVTTSEAKIGAPEKSVKATLPDASKAKKSTEEAKAEATREATISFEPSGRTKQQQKGLVTSLRAAAQDSLDPVYEATKNLTKAEDAPKTYAAALRGVGGAVKSSLEYGVRNAENEVVSEGYKQIFKGQDASQDHLAKYRVGLSAKEYYDKGLEPGISRETADKWVNEYKDKYEPIHRKIQKWRDAVIEQTYVKSGIWSPETVKNLKEKWPDYSPMYRALEEQQPGMSKAIRPKEEIKARTGSKRDIINPQEMDIVFAKRAYDNAAKNDLVNSVRDALEKNGQIEVTSPKDVGLALEEPSAENGAASVGPNLFTPKEGVISGFRDGKRWYAKVDKDISDALNNTVNLAPAKTIARMLSLPSKVLQGLVMADPAVNVGIALKMIPEAAVLSEHGWKVAYDLPEMLYHVLGKTELYQQALQDGVFNTWWKRIDREMNATEAARLTSGSKLKGLQNTIMTGFEGLPKKSPQQALKLMRASADAYRRLVGSITGNTADALQLSEYVRNIEKYGDNPKARKLAAAEARRLFGDTMARGVYADFLEAMPFYNTAIQSLNKMVEKASTDPTGFAANGMPVVAGTLALWLVNRNNPKYQELTDEDKLRYWHLFTKDGQHFKVGTFWQNGALFKGLTELVAEQIMSEDPVAFKSWFDHFKSQTLPGLPPTLSLFTDLKAGTKFNELPIVSKRIENLPQEEQYDYKTSELAKKTGQLLGYSPAKIDHILHAFSTPTIIHLADRMLSEASPENEPRDVKFAKEVLFRQFIAQSPQAYTRYQQQFYEIKDEQEGRKAALKLFQERGNDAAIEKVEESIPRFDRALDANKKINSLYSKIYKIAADSSLTGEQKRAQMDNLRRQIQLIAQDTVEDYRELKKNTK